MCHVHSMACDVTIPVELLEIILRVAASGKTDTLTSVASTGGGICRGVGLLWSLLAWISLAACK